MVRIPTGKVLSTKHWSFEPCNTVSFFSLKDKVRVSDIPPPIVHTGQKDPMGIHFSDCEDTDQHGTRNRNQITRYLNCFTNFPFNNSGYVVFLKKKRNILPPAAQQQLCCGHTDKPDAAPSRYCCSKFKI